MSAQLTDEEALNRVASYCSAAEHCRAEVNEKLQRWGIAYETIARILERLETEKYIDDERFCRAFLRPYFLRSLTRESRVKNPAAFNVGL